MKNKLKNKLFTITISLLMMLIPVFNVNAATSSIIVSSSSSKVVVGNTFKVYVKVSGSVALGSWEYSMSYDSSIIKLTSGSSYVVDYGNGTLKSKTYTYSFKAIKSGSSKISVKSYDVIGYSSESSLHPSISSTTVKTVTQAELEASYSTNNYLSSLSVAGYSISPAFNKDTLNYKVTLKPDAESIIVKATRADSSASIKGAGTIEVSEGENKISIVVTSQKGTVRTYTITATIVDPNPIETTINNIKYSVVKKASLLNGPETYTESTVIINDQQVPGFKSEITSYTLVGLKDPEGNIALYVYDETNDSYTLYQEIAFNNIKLYVIPTTETLKNYTKQNINFEDISVEGYKLKTNSKYALLYAINIESGDKGWYMYDSYENTAQRYNKEEILKYEKNLSDANLVIGILGVALLIDTILMLIAIRKLSSNKVKKVEIPKLKKEKIKVEKIEAPKKEKIKKIKEKQKDLEKTKELIIEKNKEKEKVEEQKEKVLDQNNSVPSDTFEYFFDKKKGKKE